MKLDERHGRRMPDGGDFAMGVEEAPWSWSVVGAPKKEVVGNQQIVTLFALAPTHL
jgi:hypothetical protein